MAIVTPPPITTKSHINPWLSILVLLVAALAAWALVAKKAKPPAGENQAPGKPTLTLPEGDQPMRETPTLIGTVTFIQGLSLTTLATIEDNPSLAANRVLVVALHQESAITDKIGTTLTADAIKVGDRIAVWSSMKLNEEEPILAGDKIVVNP